MQGAALASLNFKTGLSLLALVAAALMDVASIRPVPMVAFTAKYLVDVLQMIRAL